MRASSKRMMVLLSLTVLVTTGTAASAAPHQASTCPPARVSGLSYVLDAMQTGAAAGPGITYGILVSVLGTPLPGPLGAAQQQLLAAGGGVAETLGAQGPAGVQQLRASVAMFAVFNDYTNMVLALGADNMDSFATQAGPTIQPFDLTLHELAGIVRNNEENPTPCSATIQGENKHPTKAGLLALAFVQGGGPRAAALIRGFHYESDPASLGKAISLGLLAATASNSFDNYRAAVAYALPHAGVSMQDATAAFQNASGSAVQSSEMPGDGLLAGRTMADTYQAYSGV